jgi:hypothetical protein
LVRDGWRLQREVLDLHQVGNIVPLEGHFDVVVRDTVAERRVQPDHAALGALGWPEASVGHHLLIQGDALSPMGDGDDDLVVFRSLATPADLVSVDRFGTVGGDWQTSSSGCARDDFVASLDQ